MKILLFGATGMVGQGVLRECLKDPGVTEVLAVVRSPTGLQDAKLKELIHKDFFDFTALEPQFAGVDACLFCLGISSVGMNEADYTRTTYDITMAAAKSLLRASPQVVFEYVSGASTDSSEKGRSMWARVKGRTENALLAMPFKAAYMFRPGYIQPMHGVKSKTRLYAAFYALGAWMYPFLRRVAPNAVSTSEGIGRAMIRAAREGAPKKVLEVPDINALAGGA